MILARLGVGSVDVETCSGASLVLHSHVIEVVAQSEGSHEAVGEADVRFVEESEVELRSVEGARNLLVHSDVEAEGFKALFGDSLSLCSSLCFRYAATDKRLIHSVVLSVVCCLIDGVIDLLRYSLAHRLVEIYRCVGTQPLI